MKIRLFSRAFNIVVIVKTLNLLISSYLKVVLKHIISNNYSDIKYQLNWRLRIIKTITQSYSNSFKRLATRFTTKVVKVISNYLETHNF